MHTSPNFQFGGTYFSSCPGNTSRYLHVVSHVVGHDAPWLLQANGVPPLPEGPFLHVQDVLEKQYWTSGCFQLVFIFYSTAILYISPAVHNLTIITLGGNS